MSDDLQFSTSFGEEMRPFIPDVALFRIEGFRAYSYLYEGTLDYERRYLEKYATESRAMLIRVMNGDETVAIATALPLASSCDIVADAAVLMSRAGYDIKTFFYYAEALVKPAFRELGIARRVYVERERCARQFGFTNLCLAVVERPDGHPLKPARFKRLERIWVRDGFSSSNVVFKYDWPTIQADGRVVEQENPRRFWVRPLVKGGAA